MEGFVLTTSQVGWGKSVGLTHQPVVGKCRRPVVLPCTRDVLDILGRKALVGSIDPSPAVWSCASLPRESLRRRGRRRKGLWSAGQVLVYLGDQAWADTEVEGGLQLLARRGGLRAVWGGRRRAVDVLRPHVRVYVA